MHGFIRLQQIADDLAEHPLLRDISFERIINYTQELIKIVGSPKLFIDKTAVVNIHEYRGELPCDFIEMNQVRGVDGSEYLYTMDTFHNSPKKDYVGISTYKIQGSMIFSSEKECDIEISYKAMPIDEEGYPLLPDNETFKRALEAYIKYKRFTILFDQNKISGQVFQHAQQDYYACIGQAEIDLVRPTLDEMEVISNMMNSLILRTTEHKNNYSTAHNREYIIRH